MKSSPRLVAFTIFALLCGLEQAFALRFVLETEECFSYSIPDEKYWVYVAFAVTKADGRWKNNNYNVDLVVKDPTGTQIRDSRDQMIGKVMFLSEQRGQHQVCFINKSPGRKSIDFVTHIRAYSTYMQEHAKEEHVDPLSEEISKLGEALQKVQYEQEWMEALSKHQAFVNEALNKGTMYKSVLESATLIGASVLQVFLLRRLFERKLSASLI